MTTYKLTYFNIRVKAEVIRLIFEIAGQEYEDYRCDGTDWPELKKTAPFGQCPLLEVDGVKMCQSKAIIRFLAKRFGLSPKDDMGEFRADMIMDIMDDIWERPYVIHKEKDNAKKAELTAAYVADVFPLQFGGLEKQLCENEGGDGYIVGDKLSYADLCVFHYHEYVTIILGHPIPWDKYPKLQALVQRVASHPKVAAWVARRPDTKM